MTNILKEGDFNMDILKRLVFTPKPSTPEDVTNMLRRIYLGIINNPVQPCSHVEVTYEKPKYGTGNENPISASIGRQPNLYRKLVTFGKGLYDADMAASGVQIMTHVYKSHGLEWPCADHYLESREYHLKLIDRDRSTAKKEVDTVVGGGNPPFDLHRKKKL